MAGEDGTTEADDVWAPAHQHDCSAAEVRGYIHSAGPGDDGKGEGAFLPGWRAARQGACAAPRRAGTRRERTQAAGVSVAVATRPGLRRRGTPCRKRRVFFLISGGKLPPSILPIAFAALLSAWAVQPAGNGSVLDAVGQQHQQCPAACPHGACNATLSGSQPGRLAKGAAGEWAESWETWEREHGAESFVVQHGSPAHQSLLDNGGAAHESLLLNPHFVALLVRSAFILLEFGSRPLKNAKKMLSCSLICYWLYQYRYSGSGDSVLGYRLDMSMLEPSLIVLTHNAPFVVIFLVLKLVLKLADLLGRFVKIPKAWKRLRILKLLKLRKLAKVKRIFAALSGGFLGVSLTLKTLKYVKLLKAFTIFKVFKVLKVMQLALVVLCIDSAVVPAWGYRVCSNWKNTNHVL